MLNLCLGVAIIFFGYIYDVESASGKKLLTKQQAMVIAEKTSEVEGLYGLQNGKFAGCIEKKVLKPCESDWVSCIDEAWVVQFVVGEKCSVKHDGRLGLNLLVDAVSSSIISRFPEKEYFENEKYCQEDYDCLLIEEKGLKESRNFVYGQIDEKKGVACDSCQCKENLCIIKGN